MKIFNSKHSQHVFIKKIVINAFQFMRFLYVWDFNLYHIQFLCFKTVNLSISIYTNDDLSLWMEKKLIESSHCFSVTYVTVLHQP